MERRFRLTRSIDFKRVRSSGKSFAHPLVVLVATPTEYPIARIGVAASHTVGGAVERNRAKRLLREASRTLLPHLRPADIILIARAPLAKATLTQASEAINTLCNRAKLFLQDHEQ